MILQLKPIWEGWNESGIKFDAIVTDDGAFRALEFAPEPFYVVNVERGTNKFLFTKVELDQIMKLLKEMNVGWRLMTKEEYLNFFSNSSAYVKIGLQPRQNLIFEEILGDRGLWLADVLKSPEDEGLIWLIKQ